MLQYIVMLYYTENETRCCRCAAVVDRLGRSKQEQPRGGGRRLKKWGKRLAAGFVLAGALYVALLSHPKPLFNYWLTYGRFSVWSDRPIDPAMVGVLDDAARRLATSELHDPRAEFRIFICNDGWRLRLLARDASIGGSADTLVSRNIYLREADIAANRIVPPHGRLADADERPLSYFIAHEATHVMQSRAFGRWLRLRYPRWLVEGHADLVAKAGDFDIAENRRLLRAGDARLDPGRSGLYRGYHLMVASLLGSGRTIRQLFADPPSGAAASEAAEGR
jgi:hypothetical protein